MAEQHIEIDIPRLIRGMDRINEEKREIKLVTRFLARSFERIASSAKERQFANHDWREVMNLGECDANENRDLVGVFSVCDSERNKLIFTISRNSSHAEELCLVIGEKSMTIFKSVSVGIYDSFVEEIPPQMVGVCHTLLSDLVTETIRHDVVKNLIGEIPKRMQIFYEAAERAIG